MCIEFRSSIVETSMSKHSGDPFLAGSKKRGQGSAQPAKPKSKPTKEQERTFRDPKILRIFDA
jgi:hypothetical protein